MNYGYKIWLILCIALLAQACNNGSTEKSSQLTPVAPLKDTVVKDKTDSAQGYRQVSADWLLVPGVSAGKTKINEDADLVYKLLGDPDGGDAAMGKAIAIWFSHHDTTANSVAIYTTRDMGNDPAASVKQIRVTSKSFRTASNIGPASSLNDIKAAYTVKNVEHYKDGATTYTVYSASSGIAFEVNEKELCVAVIIFPAGEEVNGTYLKFRTTAKSIDKGE